MYHWNCNVWTRCEDHKRKAKSKCCCDGAWLYVLVRNLITHRSHSFCLLAEKESYNFRASNFSIASITSSDAGAEGKATRGVAKGDWRTSNFGVVSIMSSDAGTEREVTTGRVSKSIADECDDSSYPKRKEKCKSSETTTLESHWIQELTCKDNIKIDRYLEVSLHAISHPRSSKSNRTNTSYGGRSINAFCHRRDRFQRRQSGRRTKTSYGKGRSIDAFCHRRDRFQRRQSVWWEGEEKKAKKMNESASEEEKYGGGRSIDVFCLRRDRFQRRQPTVWRKVAGGNK